MALTAKKIADIENFLDNRKRSLSESLLKNHGVSLPRIRLYSHSKRYDSFAAQIGKYNRFARDAERNLLSDEDWRKLSDQATSLKQRCMAVAEDLRLQGAVFIAKDQIHEAQRFNFPSVQPSKYALVENMVNQSREDLQFLAANNVVRMVNFRGDIAAKCVTEPIILDSDPEIELGKFELVLRHNEYSPICVALSPPPAHPNNPHPNLSGNHLCYGEGGRSSWKASCEGRIIDLFDITIQVLSTFNPQDYSIHPRDWNTYQCGFCDRRYSMENLQECPNVSNGKCHRKVCKTCAEKRGGRCYGCFRFGR